MNFFILKRKIFKKKNIFYCKYFFNLFKNIAIESFQIVLNYLIELNMDLILNIADKFFFSVFKLIKKVSL